MAYGDELLNKTPAQRMAERYYKPQMSQDELDRNRWREQIDRAAAENYMKPAAQRFTERYDLQQMSQDELDRAEARQGVQRVRNLPDRPPADEPGRAAEAAGNAVFRGARPGGGRYGR